MTPPASDEDEDSDARRIVNISASHHGIAAYRIDQIVIDSLDRLKAAATVLPLEAMVDDEPPFVGRGSELDRLAGLLLPDRIPATCGVVAIAGPPGVGKTALMKQAAVAASDADAFRKVVFADLRGYVDDPDDRVPAAAVLSKLLILLGVEDDDLPSDPAHLSTAYQIQLDELAAQGESVLLLLDNVSERAQFDTLRPARPPHVAVITTRDTFAHIPKPQVVEVEAMAPAEAVEVLKQALTHRNPNDDRARDYNETVRRLAELCDHLPLALQIVAALLADEPDRPMRDLVAELAAEEQRLSSLDYDRDLSVRAAFSLSYNRLPNDLQRLFRLLSVVAGGDVGLVTAGWLIEATHNAVRPQLMALVRSHLVQQHVRNRWSMHDLIRLYAMEQSAKHPADANRALLQIINRYVLGMGAAADWLTGAVSERARILLPSPQIAAAWFEAERTTAIAMVKTLVKSPEHREWNLVLAVVLGEILQTQRHWISDSHDVALIGVSLVPEVSNRHYAAVVLNQYGSVLRRMSQFDNALRAYQRAIEVAEEAGHFATADAARGNMGNVYVDQGRDIDDVLAVYWDDVRASRESDHPNRHSEAIALGNIGSALTLVERYDDALEPLRDAMAIHRDHDNEPGIASIAKGLGATLCRLGRNEDDPARLTEAIALLEDAADIYARRGNASGLADIRTNLGTALCQLRRSDEGIPHLEAAAAYFEQSDQVPLAAHIREDISSYRQDAQRRRTWSPVPVGGDRYRFTNVSGFTLAQITVDPLRQTEVVVDGTSDPHTVPTPIPDGTSFTAVVRGPGARITATAIPSMRTISITFAPY